MTGAVRTTRLTARLAILVLLVGTLTAVLAGEARAAILRVPSQFDSIQEAVDAASRGDTIWVMPRKHAYFENVVITKNRLTIMRDPNANGPVIVDGRPASGSVGDTAFDIDANFFTMRRITIRHATSPSVDCDGRQCRFYRVRFDGRISGDCLQIDGPGAVVHRSVFQACDSNAMDINNANNLVLTGNRIPAPGTDSDCVELDNSENVRVEWNLLRLCEDSNGFDLGNVDDSLFRWNNIGGPEDAAIDADSSSTGNRFVQNKIFNVDSDEGIDVNGGGNLIAGNWMENMIDSGNGVEADGDNNVIKNNWVLSAGDDCYDLNGANLRVIGNWARGCDGGFEIDGANPIIRNNRVTQAGDDDGFDVDCVTMCGNGKLIGNFASGVNNDDDGFDISVPLGTGRFQILRNTAKRNIADGFNLFGVHNAVIRGNKAIRNGAEEEEGFDLDGNCGGGENLGNNVFVNNVAIGNGGHGFDVSLSGNTFRDNRALRNHADGFHVDDTDCNGEATTGNVFMDNRAWDNRADGFENDGTNTRYRRNSAGDNRKNRDCTNDGTIAVKTNNFCKDGSNFNNAGSGIDRAQ